MATIEEKKQKYFLDTLNKEILWLDFNKEDQELMFDYSDNEGKFHHSLPPMKFFTIVLNKIDIGYEVAIDACKIKINKDLWSNLAEQMTEEAKAAGYPDAPNDESEYSKKQPALLWMNYGPSADENIQANKIKVEKGAFIREDSKY